MADLWAPRLAIASNYSDMSEARTGPDVRQMRRRSGHGQYFEGMDTDQEYWFCLTHHAVEQRGHFCSDNDRLGPYPDPAAAARALEKVKERNEAWDNDPDWN